MAVNATKKFKIPNNAPSWVGKKFACLTIIGFANRPNYNANLWVCRCDCGNITQGQPSIIRACKNQKYCKSCAARKRDKYTEPLIGQRIGRLIILGRAEGRLWLCQCDCGVTCKRQISHVRRGKIAGCNKCAMERLSFGVRKHGGTSSKLYFVWRGMKDRCNRKTVKGYKNYGGKGIIVCDEWQSFVIFRQWAFSNGYIEGLSIERIDSNKNYEPNNCEWITKSENSRRMNVNVKIKRRGDYIFGLLSMAG